MLGPPGIPAVWCNRARGRPQSVGGPLMGTSRHTRGIHRWMGLHVACYAPQCTARQRNGAESRFDALRRPHGLHLGWVPWRHLLRMASPKSP
jgi:hypothetical protein